MPRDTAFFRTYQPVYHDGIWEEVQLDWDDPMWVDQGAGLAQQREVGVVQDTIESHWAELCKVSMGSRPVDLVHDRPATETLVAERLRKSKASAAATKAANGGSTIDLCQVPLLCEQHTDQFNRERCAQDEDGAVCEENPCGEG